MFRGDDSWYKLEPAIERIPSTIGWSALEYKASSEFKSRARGHLAASMIPEDEFTWLALMQHYGIPTRLLDFTYSPFVALYFAIHNGRGHKGLELDQDRRRLEHVRIWAVDALAVKTRFQDVALGEFRKIESSEGTELVIAPEKQPNWSPFHLSSFSDYLDRFKERELHQLI